MQRIIEDILLTQRGVPQHCGCYLSGSWNSTGINQWLAWEASWSAKSWNLQYILMDEKEMRRKNK